MTNRRRASEPGAAARGLIPQSPEFRFSGGEFLGAGLQRLSLEQLDYAIAALETMRIDIGIHEARKSLRRVRALLRLVRDPLGDRVYRTENVAIRDVGRVIGSSRDATVMVETVAGLSFLYRGVLEPAAFDTLRAHLLERDKLIQRRVSGPRLEEAVSVLTAVRDRFAVWPRSTLNEGFPEVSDGLLRVYRRGRNRMVDAYREGSAEAFHVWRKRVRYLRFQMALLEGMWPGFQRGMVSDLAHLAEALGADRDLSGLNRLLNEEPEMLPAENARHVLQDLLVRNRTRLREAARPVGTRLYAEEPPDFVRRLGVYWMVWRPGC